MESGCISKTVWILISWLLMKPADLDLHCFQMRWNFEKVISTLCLLGQIFYFLHFTTLQTDPLALKNWFNSHLVSSKNDTYS